MPAPDVPMFLPGVEDCVAHFNANIRDPFAGLLSSPAFRARKTTSQTLTEGSWNTISWPAAGVDEDTHTGWASGAPTRYTVPAGWGGWWLATGAVSLSGTGTAGLVLIPGIAVDGTSPIGVGPDWWEGPELFVPTGAATQPKTAAATWRIYADAGSRIELGLYYSSESAITAPDTTAGAECRLELTWDGV